MNSRNRTWSVLTLAGVAMATLAFTGTPANAELMVYESFDYTAGQELTGLNGGTGWGNAWFTSSGSPPSAALSTRLSMKTARLNHCLPGRFRPATAPFSSPARSTGSPTAHQTSSSSSTLPIPLAQNRRRDWPLPPIRQTSTSRLSISSACGIDRVPPALFIWGVGSTLIVADGSDQRPLTSGGSPA